MDSLVIGYRAFMKFTRWYLRLATSAAAGFMAAMLFCLGGARLGGSRDEVTAVLLVVALPLWIVVSVISYKALKPRPENRDSGIPQLAKYPHCTHDPRGFARTQLATPTLFPRCPNRPFLS